ncbi:hypothetical protein hmeg3_09605 [Herbaspirillum sp. meg3]|uniref:hypothetical protein n=1 Tax=Herbaspirillum sp. meg3 TaxID=2025949 RepID=UPI000B98EE70|nr:hypothetical protein [Herbaspirillum sp. meg3]ASU38526.1 hypothetical protein hmeg3_09605 [Herbaspirillum sp. meg3]
MTDKTNIPRLMRKRKNAHKAVAYPRPMSTQLAILDSSGNIPFSYEKEVDADPNNSHIFYVDSMHFYLSPAPNDPEKAMRIVMNALATFHREHPEWRDRWPEKVEQPIRFECWDGCRNGSVIFNTARGDKFIYATHLGGDDVALMLPNTKPYSWQNAGLSWLRNYERCCDRNAWNPRPWRGKPCGCN